MYEKYYSEGVFSLFSFLRFITPDFPPFPSPIEALQAKIGTLSLEAQTKLEKETAKKEVKAEAKADAALKKKMASKVRHISSDFFTQPPIHPFDQQPKRPPNRPPFFSR